MHAVGVGLGSRDPVGGVWNDFDVLSLFARFRLNTRSSLHIKTKHRNTRQKRAASRENLVLVVSDQVRHKPGCTVTKVGYKLKISDLGSRGRLQRSKLQN